MFMSTVINAFLVLLPVLFVMALGVLEQVPLLLHRSVPGHVLPPPGDVSFCHQVAALALVA